MRSVKLIKDNYNYFLNQASEMLLSPTDDKEKRSSELSMTYAKIYTLGWVLGKSWAEISKDTDASDAELESKKEAKL